MLLVLWLLSEVLGSMGVWGQGYVGPCPPLVMRPYFGELDIRVHHVRPSLWS
jgi:hypothetical protein